jgi:hypothetical protein
MMAVHSLRFIVPSDMSSPCRCVCHAAAGRLCLTQHPPWSSPAQTACRECAMAVAWPVFAAGHAARYAVQPGHRYSERERRDRAECKAEGKIKGRGTLWRERFVCTWGWRGTREGMAVCREDMPSHVRIEENACFTRCAALTLERAAL